VNLRKYIPNRYAPFPNKNIVETVGSYMKSMVIVATQTINNGDEILIDYKLNTKAAKLPDWYQSYDADLADKRWSFTEDKGWEIGAYAKKLVKPTDDSKST
jgi:hypothetical protein